MRNIKSILQGKRAFPSNFTKPYSYDIHGNVNTLVQDNPSLDPLKQRYKKVDYDYDLISGKVNDVYYQKDSIDAFTHHYEYDADNRITEVFTSHYPNAKWTGHKHHLWDNDAKYWYYAHGPLARVEYGNHHVQGVDYYYTIQGWIKGVNSNILNPNNDGGRDGLTATGNPNSHFAKDAYGYTLGYFSGDYSPIDTSKWNTVTKRFEANTSGSSLTAARHDLFNGNIGHMVTTIIQPDTNYASQTILPQGTAYKYDQLNRLIEMKAFVNLTNNAFGSTTYNGSYNNRFAYDANGNILSQIRKDQNGITFDSLTYHYNIQNGQKQQNRLYHVNDTVSASVMNDDIDNQGSYNNALTQVNKVNNYKYDQIGNLVRDSAEGIAKIDWTVYGKIKSITHRTGYYKMIATDTVRPPDLVFNYDAAGNRISKTTKPRTATGLKANTYWTNQYYVRDAGGNVLSVYNQRDSTAISTLYFKQTEKHIYGSSRIGIDNTQTELIGATFSTDTSNHYLGNKSYELTNHLGNVLTTVSDKKMPLDTNANDTIDFYVADIRSATDYAAFGAPMAGRTFSAGAFAYGFNGMEKDDEVEGSGNIYTAEYWAYDSRLGRRWNLDPDFDASISPYACFDNNPIRLSDPDGDSPKDGDGDGKGDDGKCVTCAKKGAPSGPNKNENSQQDNLKPKPVVVVLPPTSQPPTPTSEVGPDNRSPITKDQDKINTENHFGEGSTRGWWAYQLNKVNPIGDAIDVLNFGFNGGVDRNGTPMTSGQAQSKLFNIGLAFAPELIELNSVRLFSSTAVGVGSKTFGNKFVLGYSGSMNTMGNVFKMGWSSRGAMGGGMQIRLGFFTNVANKNQAMFHVYLPGTFIPNKIANPIMTAKILAKSAQ